MADHICGNLTNVTNGTLWLENMKEFDIEKTFNYPRHIFEKAITPIIFALGFPGNLLSIIIWIRPKMRQSSGCYLAALGFANFVFLLLNIPYYLAMSWNITFMDHPVVCETYPYISLAFQYLSPILVLGFTVERYISICHPFAREKLCTTKRALTVVGFIYILSFVLCAIQVYFWKYDFEKQECTVRLNVMYGGTKSFWSIWTWLTEMLIFLAVPLAVFIFNVLVIREIKRISSSNKMIVHDGSSEKKSATTVMLLAVSFYLIFTTLPIAITYAVQVAFPVGDRNMYCPEQVFLDPKWQSNLSFTLCRSVIQMIGLSHYSFNFYIYLITGKLFRRELNIFLFGKCITRFSLGRSKSRRENVSMLSNNGEQTAYTLIQTDGRAYIQDSQF